MAYCLLRPSSDAACPRKPDCACDVCVQSHVAIPLWVAALYVFCVTAGQDDDLGLLGDAALFLQRGDVDVELGKLAAFNRFERFQARSNTNQESRCPIAHPLDPRPASWGPQVHVVCCRCDPCTCKQRWTRATPPSAAHRDSHMGLHTHVTRPVRFPWAGCVR